MPRASSNAGSFATSARSKLCAVVSDRIDAVFRRRRLQLEIELAAEALAQREPPRAIDAAAERRVDHELHAARFIEEALEHDGVLRRQVSRARRAPAAR